MPDIADAVQLRILTHYAAGTELSSIAAMLRVGYDEVIDVVNTVARFDRSRASELIRKADRPRPTAPTPAPRQRIEFKLPPVDVPKPVARKVVQAVLAVEPTPPAKGGLETAPSMVELPTPPEPSPASAREPEPMELPPAPAAGQRLAWWDSFLCLPCSSRYFLPNDCCGQPTLPVTVTVTAREVSR